MIEEFDIDKSLYRKFYAGLRNDPRLKRVSMSAAFLYVALHLVSDDWGNFPRSLEFIREEALPGREEASESVASWCRELEAPGPPPLLDDTELAAMPLIRPYDATGRKLYHIVDFTRTQPAGKNGRRIRRYPESPWDRGEACSTLVRSVESAGIRGNPRESGKIRSAALAAPLAAPLATAAATHHPPDLPAAAADFEKRGIDARTLALMSLEFSADDLAKALLVFDERAGKERIGNPAGLFRTLLKSGGTPPLPRQTRMGNGFSRKETPAEKEAHDQATRKLFEADLRLKKSY